MKQLSDVKQQSGFTLIELVMVIVILGILAATALPKFVDLKTDAALAAVQAVAGAVSSASTSNYGVCMLRGTGGTDCTRLNTATPCAALTTAQPNLLPTGYSVTTETTCASVAAGAAAVDCTITGTNSQTAIAKIICTG